MTTLRLLVTEQCPRACPGCCNRDWDLANLPICTSFKGYDEILLTGGEPMLFKEEMRDLIARINRQTDAPVYFYTADLTDHDGVQDVLDMAEGMTVTLHEPEDLPAFLSFVNFQFNYRKSQCRSLRVNSFKGVPTIHPLMCGDFVIKDEIEWIANCPLPENETFMRLAELW